MYSYTTILRTLTQQYYILLHNNTMYSNTTILCTLSNTTILCTLTQQYYVLLHNNIMYSNTTILCTMSNTTTLFTQTHTAIYLYCCVSLSVYLTLFQQCMCTSNTTDVLYQNYVSQSSLFRQPIQKL